MKQPPALALSLLRVFLQDKERDAIEGDLLEEFQSHPSALWFWGQVAASLSHLTWLSIRRAPLRMIGAMFAGYFSMAAAIVATFSLGPRAIISTLTFELASGFLCAILGGYIAARISRGTGVTGMIGLCVFTTLMALVSLASIPLWKELALMSAFLPGMLTGGYLRARSIAPVTHRAG